MLTRWMLAAIHLFGFAMAVGSVWARGRALNGTLDRAGLKRVFEADSWWGLSAIILIGTGLYRAFGGVEKGTQYYLSNHAFLGKMACVILILILEVAPMLALIKWRIATSRGQAADTHLAGRYARISYIQAVLLLVILMLATGMARGNG
jgi:putative membrane protein